MGTPRAAGRRHRVMSGPYGQGKPRFGYEDSEVARESGPSVRALDPA